MLVFKISAKLAFIFLFIITNASAELGTNLSNEPIFPLPLNIPGDREKIILGRRLFEDKRLSKNQTISCASCHQLNHGGSDGRTRSIGVNGTPGEINAPTVFNSGFNFRQFWNGRAKTLEEQVDGPIQHPKEMGDKWDNVIAKISADKNYSTSFSQIYKNGITKENIKDAIASFEKSLVTINSRFDQYLRGNKTAINDMEKSGYQRFKSFGCIACHQGMNVGGNMFQTMGVMGNYFKDRATPITDADLGRYTVTKDELDKHVFRVPSLRNVELTSPYFHDGSAKTLEAAVGIMAKYQLGRTLSKDDVKSIVAFLKTLTGETPKTFIQNDKLGSSK